MNRGHRNRRSVTFEGVVDDGLTHHVEYSVISPVKVPQVHKLRNAGIGKVELQEINCVVIDGIH